MYYGTEFTATAVSEWLERLEVKTLFIEPGSPGRMGSGRWASNFSSH
jgi:hypothetical protein